jgi:hypothetical protein
MYPDPELGRYACHIWKGWTEQIDGMAASNQFTDQVNGFGGSAAGGWMKWFVGEEGDPHNIDRTGFTAG